MGTLEIVMLVLWVLCVFINLFGQRTFGRFVLGAILDGIVIGVVYVGLHFLIKYW